MLPGINDVIKAQESRQTRKHTMSGIPSLKTFSCKSGSLRVWKPYDVGPGKRFKPAHEKLLQEKSQNRPTLSFRVVRWQNFIQKGEMACITPAWYSVKLGLSSGLAI